MISGVLKIGTLELPWLNCDVRHKNAIVSHESPGVPGGVQESTGRNPYAISATVVLKDDWADHLQEILDLIDVEQEGDLTLADGRVIHVAVDSATEQWKQQEGVGIALEMVEDGEVDSYTVPTGPSLARTAPEIARGRGWTAAANALDALREAMDAASPPTMGEMVALYGAAAALLLAAEEVALEAEDRAGYLDAAKAATLRWAALTSLSEEAREAIDAAG
jgi:hypothetical protein